MLDQATDRGKTAFRLGRRHADACRRPAVDTEHLFLGLLEEGTGVAATALQQLKIDLTLARAKVTKGEEPERKSARQLPLTDALRACLEASQGLAKELGHPYVSTEHLLLGLLKDPNGNVPELLQKLGTSPAKVQAEVFAVLGERPPTSAMGLVEEEEAAVSPPLPTGDAERWRSVDEQVAEADGHRPFTAEVAERLRARTEPRFLFASAALGRREALSLHEVQAFLEREVVSGGHPLERYLDLQRHQRQFERMVQHAKQGAPLELGFVRELHAGLAGEDAPSEWKTEASVLTRRRGHEFAVAEPDHVEALMAQLSERFAEVRAEVHPVRAAAWLYQQLFRIAPFKRDNGRVIRLLVSGFLQNAGYPALVILPTQLGDLLDALVACERAAACPPDQLSGPEACDALGDVLATCLAASAAQVLAVARGEDLQAHELPAAVARGQEESMARLLESGDVSWRVTAGRQVRLLFDRLHALAMALPCSGPLYSIEIESADVVPAHRVAGSGLARALPVGDSGVLGLVQLAILPSKETPALRFPPQRRMRVAIAASQMGLHVVSQWDEDRPQRSDGPAEAEAWAEDQLNASLTRSVDAKRKAYELGILDANLGREEQRKIRRTLRLQREQPLPTTRPLEPVEATSPVLTPVAVAAPPASERATRRIRSTESLKGLTAIEPPLEF